ncbi:MAG TPA: tyrosine-type recombinase/integrase [Sphingomicrobium sp.]|nr:tyrosine-type recombinase/integrase [Sphingomicrobium sp.]
MTDILAASLRSGAKLPLRAVEVWGIRIRLQVQNSVRDLALFDITLDSKLRGCDVVSLRIGDVLSGGSPRNRGTVMQQKTGRPVQFEITEQAGRSITAWLDGRKSNPSDWLFPSRMDLDRHLSTRQYSRLLKKWVAIIGLTPSGYGTHTLRRTKVCLLYRKTGNLRACQLLLGHSKLESTVRYLGVEVDDALQLSEGLEL